MFRFVILSAMTLVFASCSNEQSGGSKIKDVSDIRTMTARNDGLFDVVCRNGQAEVRSAAEIKSGQVCGSSSGSGGALICVSRDNDGRNPWSVAKMADDGSVQKFSTIVFETVESCKEAVASSKNLFGTLTLLCGSRDADGRSPFAAFKINADNSVTKERLIYGTADECSSSLQKARQTATSILACASRDADGRNPWALFAVTASGTTKTQFVYNNLAECLAQ
jgi:hypothetical protein